PLAFTSNATAPGDRIGTVTLTLPQAAQGTVYTLSFDAKLTVLANQAASVFESQFNRKLKLVSGTVTIGGASTATTVSSSANPTNAGSDVTFTAHVSSATPGTITGTVAFLDGTTTIGYGTLQSGVATLTTSALATGSRSITAVYEGSATYQTSTSPAITQTVNVSLASPANLTATATSTSRVVLTWGSVSGATSYEIRRSFDNSAFVTIAAAGATTYNDDTVVGGKTYVYTVRALGAGGASSPYSPKDAATTVLFADDPIVTGTTRIKLAHLTTLRTAVNAFRISAGLGAMTFTDPSPTTATKVKRTHIDELRTALQTARALLGLPSVAFTDPTIAAGSNMKTAHVQELRYAVQ
ncbi:MAG TPA: Ig-like domain repeat protein, partial [Thermoanaerobaculia bacterium]|nr:Ig-like domain repeat protein [Thermoanaerobaculia bacterium]